jgi:O-antigen/teichoic acid export membrane protein
MFFTVIVAVIAPIVAIFFREPGITPIMRVMSISFIFSGLGVVPQALLIRKMRFRKLVFIENVSFVVGAGIGVGMALSGWGVWSLVIQSLSRVLSMAVALWLLNPIIPDAVLSLNSLKSIASYSLNLSGFNLLNYFIRNADNMLIGRYLGSTPLGFYSLAYKWMLLPIYYISGIVGNVFFSIYWDPNGIWLFRF